MMRTYRAVLRARVALPLAAGVLAGQVTLESDNTAYGTTAGEFLLLGAGGRGTALGNAYAALATDVSALYYNPAGLAELDRAGVLLSSYDYAADTRYACEETSLPVHMIHREGRYGSAKVRSFVDLAVERLRADSALR